MANTKTLNIIENAWKHYVAEVMHPDAPLLQQRECRMAFYAGVTLLFYMHAGDHPPDLTSDEIMASIDAELHDYADRLCLEDMPPEGHG